MPGGTLCNTTPAQAAPDSAHPARPDLTTSPDPQTHTTLQAAAVTATTPQTDAPAAAPQGEKAARTAPTNGPDAQKHEPTDALMPPEVAEAIEHDVADAQANIPPGGGPITKRTNRNTLTKLAVCLLEGTTYRAACGYAGITDASFRRWRLEFPTFERLVALCDAVHQREMLRRALGDPTDADAARWQLSRNRRFRGEFSERTEVAQEQVGPPPQLTVTISQMPPARLEALEAEQPPGDPQRALPGGDAVDVDDGEEARRQA